MPSQTATGVARSGTSPAASTEARTRSRSGSGTKPGLPMYSG